MSLRTGIAFDVWLRQPDRAIETAVALLLEQDEEARHDTPGGPVMSG